MHPRHSATLGRLVDYVEVQHALVATVYEKCRLRKSEEHSWQVSLSPIFWLLGIITSIKLRLFILWSNLSRYHAEQQWEEASHLMGHIFKLMRWILDSTCFFLFCFFAIAVEELILCPSDLSVYECHYAGICWSLLKPKSNWCSTKLDMGPPKTNCLLWNLSSYNI